MSAILAGLFKDHLTAEHVRTALVREGFPTDRVQLTSPDEPGPASTVSSAVAKQQQLHDFFRQIFPGEHERKDLRSFVEGVRDGNAAVVVHPRGALEVRRALEILNSSEPLEVCEHDLANQSMERAASPARTTVLGKLVPDEIKNAVKRRLT